MMVLSCVCFPQERQGNYLFSINGFRNPSIGTEFQYRNSSLHGGYYVTNFESGVTTEFLKTGITYWLLYFGKKQLPSSFYTGVSYLRGQSRDYKEVNAWALEAGVRWYMWKGLNLRMGVIALGANQHSIRVNPAPAIAYTFRLSYRSHHKTTFRNFLRL